MKKLLYILGVWFATSLTSLAWAQGTHEIPAGVNLLVILAYIAIGVAALLALFMPLIASPSMDAFKKTGLSVVVLLVIFLIGYLIAGSDVPAKLSGRFGIGAASFKAFGGLIISFYLLLALAFLSILYTEISRLFK